VFKACASAVVTAKMADVAGQKFLTIIVRRITYSRYTAIIGTVLVKLTEREGAARCLYPSSVTLKN